MLQPVTSFNLLAVRRHQMVTCTLLLLLLLCIMHSAHDVVVTVSAPQESSMN